MENKVLFISGSGRSGTNIIKDIFGKHPKVGVLPFEYRFTIDPNGVVDFYNSYTTSWSPFLASKRIKNFIGFLRSLSERDEQLYVKSKDILGTHNQGLGLTPYPYHGWELNKAFPGYEEFVNLLEKELVGAKYPAVWPGADPLIKNHHMLYGSPLSKQDLLPLLNNFLSKCISAYLSSNKKELFVEDNTWSILFADDLKDLFPDSKMIHVLRDPRDVIASMIKQRWTPSNLKDVVLYYKEIMNVWLTKRKHLPDNFLIEIKLERLIDKKEKTIKDMCNFAEVNFDKNMLNIDLSKSNSGRYKEEFSKEEIIYIENELNEILAIYKY